MDQAGSGYATHAVQELLPCSVHNCHSFTSKSRDTSKSKKRICTVKVFLRRMLPRRNTPKKCCKIWTINGGLTVRESA